MGHITQRYKFWQFSDNFSVGWPRIFFPIAALKPWFECASFEYKEAYFSDNLNFDLYRAEQSSKKCLKWDISLKGTNFGSFWTISWSGDLGSFFWLLHWNRGSNTLLLSTKKPTFRTTWILTYIGPSNILEGKKLRSKSKILNFRLQNLIQYIYI